MGRIIRSKVFPVVVALALMLAIAPQAMPAAVDASAPLEHKVTNVNDVSFTVSWITASDEEGYVEYGTTAALGSTAHDERGAGTVDDTHHVKVDGGLLPNTLYYYDIISGETRDNNGGAHYRTITGPTLEIPQPDDILGLVFKNDGTTPAEGAIVYIRIGSSQELSTLVESSGWWGVNLGGMRAQDYQQPFPYTATAHVSLFAQGAADGTDAGTCTVAVARVQAPDLKFGPPTVTATSPPDADTDVPVETAIEVTFSKYMNTASAEAAFSISPSVSGSFSWGSSIMTFTPDAVQVSIWSKGQHLGFQYYDLYSRC